MTSEDSRALLTSAKQVIAGGVGGICLGRCLLYCKFVFFSFTENIFFVNQVLAGHPMDTIKVRLQTMPTPKPGEKPLFTSTLDCVQKTIRREGKGGKILFLDI